MPPDAETVFTPESIAAAEIRAALDKILRSAEFVGSPQLCAFLTYIVEASLSGNELGLKGQTIGTVVLGRPEGYDSQRDPIVRVEANRLRRTLASYYEKNGATDLIRIVVERGSYAPRFGRITTTSVPPVTPARRVPARLVPGFSPKGALVLGAAIAIALIAGFLFMSPSGENTRADVQLAGVATIQPSEPAGAPASSTALGSASALGSPTVLGNPTALDKATDLGAPTSPAASTSPDEPTSHDAPTALDAPQPTSPYLPSVEVMPFAILNPDETAERGDELQSGLTVALARFPELRVLAKDDKPADFRIDGEISVADRKSTIAIRLWSTQTAEVIWSASIDMPVVELKSGAGIDRIVAIVTTAIAPQFGAIAQYLSRGDAGLAGENHAYECLIEAQLQRHRLDDGSSGRIDACLRAVIDRYPTFATAWASRALFLMESYRLDTDSVSASATLKEAERLARHALQLEPTNVRAMTAVAAVAFGKGDLEMARTVGLRTIMANPYDPLSRLQYVLALIASNYPDQAMKQSAAARQLDPAHVSLYDSLEYLANIDKPATPKSLSSAERVDVSLVPYGAIAGVLAHSAAGDIAARDKAVQALYDRMPLFATDMPIALSRQFPPSAYTRHLQEALRKAGVGG